VRYYLGARPGEITVGDLDGDGMHDIVVGCSELAQLLVYWGQAGRTFSAPTSISCPPGPFRLRMVDIDIDGRLDLAILTGSGANIAVIWGDDTRDPVAHALLPLPFYPNGLDVGDVNADGITDLVVTECSNDSTVHVLPGAGNRGFAQLYPALVVPGASLCTLRLGDLNGDQMPDIAVADVRELVSKIGVAYGQSDGTFTLATVVPAGEGATDIAIADFNRDDVGDVAVVNPYSRDIALLVGPSFDPPVHLDAGVCSEMIVATQVDSAGVDLVVNDICSHSIILYRNTFAVIAGAVEYDPTTYQVGSPGKPLTATVTLPPQGSLELDPSRVQLLWRGSVLGNASTITRGDSMARILYVTFARSLLNGLEAGTQRLSVSGCAGNGSAFHAESTVQVLSARKARQWQTSLPGSIPVLVRVPDQAEALAVVRVFDSAGRLLLNQRLPVSPANVISWDGRSIAGRKVAAGIYLVVVGEGLNATSCKVALLR